MKGWSKTPLLPTIIDTYHKQTRVRDSYERHHTRNRCRHFNNAFFKFYQFQARDRSATCTYLSLLGLERQRDEGQSEFPGWAPLDAELTGIFRFRRRNLGEVSLNIASSDAELLTFAMSAMTRKDAWQPRRFSHDVNNALLSVNVFDCDGTQRLIFPPALLSSEKSTFNNFLAKAK